MSDFLLELRSEEIPARMQAGARADLEKLFRKEMGAAGVLLGEVTVWSTPRRLALIARELPDATAAVSEEIKGPRVGAPPQALEGFLRKTGLSEDQLVTRDGVLFAVIERAGRATADVLAEAIPAIVRAFPWPKSMRWGAASLSTESLRWVRPLSGIVAILGENLVECEVDGIRSGYATRGHRFHCPGEITIGGAHDYAEKLRACHVIVSHEERQTLIREGASKAAAAGGLVLVEDEGLVIENAGLTEWPVPLLGRFDEAFLAVPPEVIQLTARTNQKYFVCEKDGKLANAFVCTANIAAADGGAEIVAGNRKVLAARLSDARFFWEQDRKVSLEDQAKKLARITFHEKLGTVADKVERVAKLARWLVEEGIVGAGSDSTAQKQTRRPGEGRGLAASSDVADTANAEQKSQAPAFAGATVALADLAEQAARLCKADLVTEMVGEFPELQGLMGGYYARAEGLPDAVADAIRDHYKPVGQGDEVPTAPVTVAVSLADKLDTLCCFFAIKEKPTGSKDPFALRRSIIGILDIIISNRIRTGIRWLASGAYRVYATQLTEHNYVIWQDLNEENEDKWSPLLSGDAAYVDLGKELMVLTEEPPLIAADVDEHGVHVWESWDIEQRGLVKFRAFGFVDVVNDVTEFCFERLRDREKREGRRPDLIQAVLPREFIDLFKELGIKSPPHKLPNRTTNDDVVRILALGVALQAFINTPDGANLLAGYKRAANILKKEGFQAPLPGGEGLGVGVPTSDRASNPHPNPSPPGKGFAQIALSYTPEPAEKALIDALAMAAPQAEQAVAAEDFAAAMAALASLRAPIDAFFEQVTVNDADDEKRQSRLALLAAFRDAVHGVADFSRIEG